jgi:hypothetical protein
MSPRDWPKNKNKNFILNDIIINKMPFIRSFNGAVKILKGVEKGTTDRKWIKTIQYSIESENKIKDMKYTDAQVNTLKNMIKNLKGKRIKPKSYEPIKPKKMSDKKWQSILKRRETIIKKKLKKLSRRSRYKSKNKSRNKL